MFTFPDKYEDQEVTRGDMWYKVDQRKLVQWLKHMTKLNESLMNRLDRDPVQRGIDKGRYETYQGLLTMIQQGTIITE